MEIIYQSQKINVITPYYFIRKYLKKAEGDTKKFMRISFCSFITDAVLLYLSCGVV